MRPGIWLPRPPRPACQLTHHPLSDIAKLNEQWGIPGSLVFGEGLGGLPVVLLQHPQVRPGGGGGRTMCVALCCGCAVVCCGGVGCVVVGGEEGLARGVCAADLR